MLIKFEALLLKPEIFVTKHEAGSLIYTLSVVREQREKQHQVTHMAVTTLVVLPLESGARLSWKK